MSKLLLLPCILFFGLYNLQAQVKIGAGGIPNTNAVLELDGGSSKGLLLPRLTATEITALTTAPDGLIVYNKTDNFLYIRKSAGWQKISDATNATGGGFALPYNGTSASTNPAFWVTSSGNADAVRGYASAGDGITGISTTGKGGYFSSTSGIALVTNTGNVGIGTTNPQFLMDVNGRPRIRSNGAFNSAGIWYDKIYSAGQSSFVGTLNDSVFGIYGGGNWKFAFDHINNNFGINNSDPKAPLSFSSAVGNKIDFYYNSAVSRYGFGLQGSLLQMYSDGAGSDIAFGYGSSTSFTERMRIKGNGNVGIGINAPVNKLSVSDNTTTDAVKFYNAGTGSALYALSSGGSAINAIAFNLNNPAIKVQGGSVSITTDGKVEIGGTIKISGGNPQAGQVLTATTSTGEATWKAAAYGNTERFQFEISTTNGVVGSLTTFYNTGSAQASSSSGFSLNKISINISKTGLYHFDVSAYTYVTNNVPLSGRVSTLSVLKTATSFSTITHSPFYSAGNVTKSSVDKSFDIYINNPGIIEFFYDDGILAGDDAITVTGHLISE
jgi:hypothetical protein